MSSVDPNARLPEIPPVTGMEGGPAAETPEKPDLLKIEELLMEIFSYLPTEAKQALCANVNKQFRVVVGDLARQQLNKLIDFLQSQFPNDPHLQSSLQDLKEPLSSPSLLETNNRFNRVMALLQTTLIELSKEELETLKDNATGTMQQPNISLTKFIGAIDPLIKEFDDLNAEIARINQNPNEDERENLIANLMGQFMDEQNFTPKPGGLYKAEMILPHYNQEKPFWKPILMLIIINHAMRGNVDMALKLSDKFPDEEGIEDGRKTIEFIQSVREALQDKSDGEQFEIMKGYGQKILSGEVEHPYILPPEVLALTLLHIIKNEETRAQLMDHFLVDVEEPEELDM